MRRCWWICIRRWRCSAQVVFEVSGLGAGVHTLSVVNTGTKNPLSTSARGEVDAIEAEALVAPVAAGGVAAV